MFINQAKYLQSGDYKKLEEDCIISGTDSEDNMQNEKNGSMGIKLKYF
jgi:hypothetical protein